MNAKCERSERWVPFATPHPTTSRQYPPPLETRRTTGTISRDNEIPPKNNQRIRHPTSETETASRPQRVRLSHDAFVLSRSLPRPLPLHSEARWYTPARCPRRAEGGLG